MTTCPRCLHEFEDKKGVQSGVQSGVDSGGYVSKNIKNNLSEEHNPDLNPKASLLSVTRARVRGKAREYSEAFEVAWKAYGRKEEKLRAYGEWLIQTNNTLTETQLLPQILNALRWQSQRWAEEGWKFAPYFERYLKYRKWEDEPPPQPTARPARKLTPAQWAEEARQDAALERSADLHFGNGRGR